MVWWDFNNCFIANSPKSVRVKEFRKLANICQRYGQLQSGTFFWDTVYLCLNILWCRSWLKSNYLINWACYVSKNVIKNGLQFCDKSTGLKKQTNYRSENITTNCRDQLQERQLNLKSNTLISSTICLRKRCKDTETDGWTSRNTDRYNDDDILSDL